MAQTFPVKIKFTATERISAIMKSASAGVEGFNNKLKRSARGFDLMHQKSENMRRMMSKTSEGMKNTGASMTRNLTAPIALMGGGIIAMAAKFEKSMNEVKAVSGATGKDFTNLNDLAKQLGISTKFSASEAADGMAFLARAGFKTNEIIGALPGVLDLAAASNIELGRAAEITSSIMGQFGLNANESGRVADILAAVTANANVDMEQLSETMKFAGPIAKQFGANLEETAAAAGLLGNLGLQGSVAGTALKNAFLGFSAPGKQGRAALEAIGVQVAGSDGKMRKFSDVMRDMGKQLKNLPQQARLQVLKDVFGKIGLAGGAALQEFAEKGDLDKFSKSLEKVDGTASRMAETMNSGASGAMKRFMSAIEGLAIAIGESGVLEMFTKLVDKATTWARSLSETNKVYLKYAAIGAVVVAAMGPLISVFGVIVGLIPTLITAFTALKVATFAVATVMGIGVAPFLAIVAAIAAVVAGGVLLYKNWDLVVEKAKEFWGSIKSLFSSGLSFVSGLWDKLPKPVRMLLQYGTPVGLAATAVKGVAGFFGGGEGEAKNTAGFGAARNINASTTERTSTKENVLSLEFKNAPPGMKVKQAAGKFESINIGAGLQGAAGI